MLPNLFRSCEITFSNSAKTTSTLSLDCFKDRSLKLTQMCTFDV